MNSLEYVDELLDCANAYVLERHLELLKILKNDLEILECFKELFEGEDLDGWIEFDFGADIPCIHKIKDWMTKERNNI